MKKRGWLIIMIVFYLGAGVNHFIKASFYLNLMPEWLPIHELLVQISGIVEIILAILLLFPLTQQISAWLITVMLAVFLVCIHIPMALNFKAWNDLVWWIAIVRLPVQYLLFRWAYRYTKGSVIYFFSKPT